MGKKIKHDRKGKIPNIYGTIRMPHNSNFPQNLTFIFVLCYFHDMPVNLLHTYVIKYNKVFNI